MFIAVSLFDLLGWISMVFDNEPLKQFTYLNIFKTRKIILKYEKQVLIFHEEL